MMVTFHAPEVVQLRNEHDLRKDLEQEMPGYFHNRKIVECLSMLSTGMKMEKALRQCYSILIDHNIFPSEELDLVDLWLKDLKSIHQ